MCRMQPCRQDYSRVLNIETERMGGYVKFPIVWLKTKCYMGMPELITATI